MAQPVGVAGGPAPKPARPAKLAIPPILPAPRNMPVQAVTQAVSGNSGFSAQRPSSGSFSPAAIPQPQQSFGSRQASMQGLVKAIAKGTGTRPALPKPPDPHLWDVNPLSVGGWKIGRTDMGVDANAAPGSPILAPNDSVVKGYNANWYAGQPYELLQLTRGPNKGTYYYVAEQIDPNSLPAVGTRIARGQPVARYASSGTGIEMGLGTATPGRTLAQAQGNTGDAQHNNAPAGAQFVSTFLGKGVKPGSTPKGAPPSSGGGALNGVPSKLGPLFVAAGKKYGIDPSVLAGVAQVETAMGSNRGPSSAGAVGLMQFEPGTARGLGIDPYNDRAAVFGAAKLLNQYGYQSDPMRALGAYNGGPGNPQYSYARQVMSAAQGFGGNVAGITGSPGGSGGTVPVTSSGGAAPSAGGTVAGFPAQTQQQANAAQMTAQISGLGSFPAGTTAQQRKMNLLSSFLKGQAGGSNPFNAIGTGSAGGGMDLGSLALSSLQRLAGVTQLKVPGSRKKLF